jgi:tetratricopeptide (TPR) repeat protein
MNAIRKFDWKMGREWLTKATKEDTNFITAKIALATTYSNWMYNPDVDLNQQKKMMLKLYEKRDKMSTIDRLHVEDGYAQLFQTLFEVININKQLLEIDDQQPSIYGGFGYWYNALSQYDKATEYFKKQFEIYKKWGIKPFWVWDYTNFGDFYQKIGQYRKVKKLYKKALRDFPDSPDIIGRLAVLTRLTGNARDENRYIEKYKSIQKGNSMSDAFISQNLGLLYIFGGVFDKAEGYCRQAVSLEPANHMSLNILGWVFFNEKKIEEGLELVDKALSLSPDNYEYLDTKGWGLYMQGKYKEALEILQKSWDLRREYAFYSHEAFLHLEEAKKAVAGLKNN